MRPLADPRTPADSFTAAGGAAGLPDASLTHETRVRLALGIAAACYLAGVSLYLVARGGWPTPDFLIPPLLLIAVAAGRGWTFLIDWLPFLLLILVYEGFRGIADNINQRVHYESLIHADEWIFGGQTGPGFLQSHLLAAHGVTWYDWLASLLYSAHYVAPVVLGFVLWLKSRSLYWRFVLSLLILFFAGFLTFYIYPAAPPWLAAQDGLIPPIERVLVHTLSTLPATQPFALAYQTFSPNEVAAMPSLHAASPILIALVSLRLWGKKAIPLLAYPILGGLAWVYLGEHYFIDVLVGWLYGIAAFVLIWSLALPAALRVGEGISWKVELPLGLRPRALPGWPLAIAALAFIAYVWVDPFFRVPLHPQPQEFALLAPPRAPDSPAPLLPTPALSALPEDFYAASCETGVSFTSMVDGLLEPLASEYGAYVIGLDNPNCYALTAEAARPPPGATDVESMQIDATSSDAIEVRLPDDGPGFITVVRAGMPSQAFREISGAAPAERYLVVVRTGNPDSEADVLQVATAVGQLIFDR